MGITDFFKKESKEKKELVNHGTTGTQILSGIITEDYNNDLQFPQSVNVFDEMRKSDATIIALLRAIKNPLLSAKWQIQAGGEEKVDQDIADFVRKNLFENIKFKKFLKEALGFLDFGFYYFEKNFKVKDGMIEWDEFTPRIPRSHELWEIAGRKWVDGHPAGVTQLTNRTDEDDIDAKTVYTIPWDKIILFTNDQEGNNFEGVSILRQAYKHYFYKDLGYKISSISAERYGVGIPVAKTKGTLNSQKTSKLKEFLRNIRSNEQSYGIYGPEVEELKIMTPEGVGVGDQVKFIIDHHDKKMYDAILAGFLNLTNGDGGSNALSKDQSSFFLRALQGTADDIIDNLNDHIKELVDFNFNNIEDYPKLTVTDIGSISMDEQIKAITDLVGAGLLDITPDDKIAIRDIVKMPRLTNKQAEEIEKENELKKEKEEKAIINENQRRDDELKKQEGNPKEKEKQEKRLAESIFGNSKLVDFLIKNPDIGVDVIKSMAEDDKKKSISKREKVFLKNITQFENFLEKEYDKLDNLTKKFDKKYQDTLTSIYKDGDTVEVDGVKRLKYNRSKIKAGEKEIDTISKAFDKAVIDSKIQNVAFEGAEKKAVSTLDDNEKLLADIVVNRGKFDSFIDGYVSNMQGVIFNEARRMKENIVLNFGSGAEQELSINTAKSTVINRNVLKLSFITHPRAAYKNVLFNENTKKGFTLYKTEVPTNKLGNVLERPGGKTFSILFTILTAVAINKIANEGTGGKTAEAVGGLGLHHGSFEYYYPIEEKDLEEEEALSRQQRSELRDQAGLNE